MSQGCYHILSLLMAAFGIALAFFTYVHQRSLVRLQRFRDAQLREMQNLFQLINEYDRLVVALSYAGLRSYKVIGYFYDKYRREELSILTSYVSEEEKRTRLRKLDEEFMMEVENANLLESASILFRMLNWIYAHEYYLKSTYKDDKLFAADIADFRNKLLKLVSVYMTHQTKFVYGKYRHLRYHLESKDWARAMKTGYRGIKSADILFAYERTLSLFNGCSAEERQEFRATLDQRYEQEGIDPNLRYYPPFIEKKAS